MYISNITETLLSACHDNNTSLTSASLDVWLSPEPIYTTLDLNNELVFGYTPNTYITIPNQLKQYFGTNQLNLHVRVSTFMIVHLISLPPRNRYKT